jgi:hypothetical protein
MQNGNVACIECVYVNLWEKKFDHKSGVMENNKFQYSKMHLH